MRFLSDMAPANYYGSRHRKMAGGRIGFNLGAGAGFFSDEVPGCDLEEDDFEAASRAVNRPQRMSCCGRKFSARSAPNGNPMVKLMT